MGLFSARATTSGHLTMSLPCVPAYSMLTLSQAQKSCVWVPAVPEEHEWQRCPTRHPSRPLFCVACPVLIQQASSTHMGICKAHLRHASAGLALPLHTPSFIHALHQHLPRHLAAAFFGPQATSSDPQDKLHCTKIAAALTGICMI